MPQNETIEKLPDLSAFQKEKVANFENLNMGAYPQAELILIFLGLKPATEVDVAPWNDSPQKIAQAIKDAGLIVAKKNSKDVNGKKFTILAIARDKETLLRLKQAEGNKDHQEYGRLMGYPDTAIDAFLDDEKLLPEKDYPDMTDKFMNFKLSKDHWQEEIKVITKWSQAIKQYAPKVYEILKEFK